MPILSIDIETTSLVDLPKCGVYPYAQHKSFDVLCIAYAVDNGPITVIPTYRSALVSVQNDHALQAFEQLFTDPSYIKTAFNVQFEYVCLREFFLSRGDGFAYPELSEWRCTQAAAMTCGLPSTLDGVAVALGINHRKHSDGFALMKRFSIPDKRTGAVEHPSSDPIAFTRYMDYCAQDVAVERAVRSELKLRGFHQPPLERKVWLTNMAICDKGMKVDVELCEQVVLLGAEYTGELLREAQALGISNARSPKQVKDWLNAALDESETDEETITSLSAGHIDGLKATFADDKDALRLLTIRQELAKSSLSKFVTFLSYADREQRAKGTIRYCGAQQTGRFAGAGPQPHNLTKNVLKTAALQELITWVKAGDVQAIKTKYNGLLSLPMSQLVRAAIIPSAGHVLVLADFAAIESRVLAWLANEEWKLEVFRTTGKIYEAVAGRMYGIDPATITKESPYRDNGKRAELSLGFGGGVGALESSSRPPIAESVRKYRLTGQLPGALAGDRFVSPEQAIASLFTTSQEQRQDTVNRWRYACPGTVRFWSALEGAAKRVIASKRSESVGRLTLYMLGDALAIQLPSGRHLYYHKARIDVGKFEGTSEVRYMSVLGNTGKWFADHTYGGKLTENVVQAVASDLLREALVRLCEQGEIPVLDVHDEIVLDVPYTLDSVQYARELLSEAMTTAPAWAAGLPLAVETETQYFYHK